MLGRRWHWTLKGKIYPFLKEKSRHGRWILLLSGFPESAWTFNFSTCIHFHPVHPRSILVCGSSFFDTFFIPVCHLLVYPMIGQFWQFTSTLMSITWLRACKVKQTWRACESPLPYTAHLDMSTFDIETRETVFLKVGGVLGGLRYLKRCYRLSFLSYPSFFARPLFSLVSTDREPGTKYSDTYFADFALFVCVIKW